MMPISASSVQGQPGQDPYNTMPKKQTWSPWGRGQSGQGGWGNPDAVASAAGTPWEAPHTQAQQNDRLRAQSAANGLARGMGEQQGDNAAYQQNVIGMLQGQANGTGPNAGLAQLNDAARVQGQFAQSQGQSAMGGQLGTAEANRNASQVGSHATTAAAAYAPVLQAQQQMGGLRMLGQATDQQRAQQLSAAQQAQNSALGQVQLQLGQNQLGANQGIAQMGYNQQIGAGAAGAVSGGGSGIGQWGANADAQTNADNATQIANGEDPFGSGATWE